MFSNYTPKLTFVSGCAQTDSHHPVSLPPPPPSPPYSLQSHTAAMGRLPTPVCSTGLCPRGREVQSHQAEPLVMGAGGNAREQSQPKSDYNTSLLHVTSFQDPFDMGMRLRPLSKVICDLVSSLLRRQCAPIFFGKNNLY